MRITSISVQARDPNRVNVSIDGKYRFSLDVFQVSELGLKVGTELSEDRVSELEAESQFGKLYARALEYTMIRPRSVKEMRDYLWRKTRPTRYKSRTGELKEREGVSQAIADRVLKRLMDKGYLDDEAFTRFWVENRHVRKGVSVRRLKLELSQKGVDREIVAHMIEASSRNDEDELMKIIAKKRSRYPDKQKLVQYLVRQGFSYDDVTRAVDNDLDV